MLRCGLLGETLGHSYSPMIHHALGEYDYRLFEIPKEDLDAFLRSDCWDGLNVTIPYKRDVMAFLDSVSPEAEAIGAVNCIRRTADGKCIGNRYHLIYPPELQYIGDIGLAVGRQVGKIHGKEITI